MEHQVENIAFHTHAGIAQGKNRKNEVGGYGMQKMFQFLQGGLGLVVYFVNFAYYVCLAFCEERIIVGLGFPEFPQQIFQFSDVRLFVNFGTCRNGQRYQNPRNGGMDARIQKRQPHARKAHNGIKGSSSHSGQVSNKQYSQENNGGNQFF